MGGVIQFPGPQGLPDIPRRRWRKWRAMTGEEYVLALAFVDVSSLRRSPFAQAMIRKAEAREMITARGDPCRRPRSRPQPSRSEDWNEVKP
jgi:hypothetical protein